MAVTLRFSPPQAVKGQTIMVQASTLLAADRIEVWVFSTPDVAPSSEQGWFKLGQVNGRSGAVAWDTGRWVPGQYAVSAVVYAGSRVLAHWLASRTDTGVTVTPRTVAILPVPVLGVPHDPVETPTPAGETPAQAAARIKAAADAAAKDAEGAFAGVHFP